MGPDEAMARRSDGRMSARAGHRRGLGAMRCFRLMLGVLLYASPALAQTLTGTAAVIDGDTLEIQGERIDLYGIDAPETAQPCVRNGRQWPCGRRASGALAEMIGDKPVACEGRERGTDGRLLAVCRRDGADLNARMVREGWALAERRHGRAYVDAQARAEAGHAGIWAGAFVPPRNWRQVRQTAPQERPSAQEGPAPREGPAPTAEAAAPAEAPAPAESAAPAEAASVRAASPVDWAVDPFTEGGLFPIARLDKTVSVPDLTSENVGLQMEMEATGERGDIGLVTEWTAALLAGQSNMREVVIAQADLGIPWVEGRHDSGWVIEVAHQPSLYWPAYLLTGDNKYIDKLREQWSVYESRTERGIPIPSVELQVRANAWGLRTLAELAAVREDFRPQLDEVRNFHETHMERLLAHDYGNPSWIGPGGVNPGRAATCMITGREGRRGGFGGFALWQHAYLLQVLVHTVALHAQWRPLVEQYYQCFWHRLMQDDAFILLGIGRNLRLIRERVPFGEPEPDTADAWHDNWPDIIEATLRDVDEQIGTEDDVPAYDLPRDAFPPAAWGESANVRGIRMQIIRAGIAAAAHVGIENAAADYAKMAQEVDRKIPDGASRDFRWAIIPRRE